MNRPSTRFGIAGVIAGGVALAVGELLAGLFDSVPSPLASVGGLIVDSSPSFVKDFAIEVFGTADKAALAIGTTIVALVIGWWMGRAAPTRRWIGPLVLGAFGVAGGLAGLGEPFAEPVPVFAAAAVAVAAASLSLDLLVRAADYEEAPTDGLSADDSRRRFIRLAAGGSVGALVVGAAGRRLLTQLPEVPEVATFGSTTITTAPPASVDFALDGLTPAIVPNDEFYRIDTALVVPAVDEQEWSLRIHGDVDEEVVLTYDELLSMEPVEEYVTIACVSNEVGGGLVGNALWRGARLTEVLERAGADRDGTQLVGRSIDGFTVGFPTELAFDGREPLIAYGMNGEPLPRPHGFPARLIVPGLYGYVSATKWLSEIEITGWDEFDAYWIPRGWAKEAPIKTQSRIDVPQDRRRVEAGENTIAGVAWAPLLGIERVEVQVDDESWVEAELSDPLSDTAWVQWRVTVPLEAGDRTLRVRATDGSGSTQTEERVPPRPDGATGYHTIRVQVA